MTDAWAAFQLADLTAERAASGRAYLPFLTRPTLRCGLYHLAAGDKDPQQPHATDEVYYILEGRAALQVEGERLAAQPGAVLFVKAEASHRFVDIEEDLHVLVFFTEATE